LVSKGTDRQAELVMECSKRNHLGATLIGGTRQKKTVFYAAGRISTKKINRKGGVFWSKVESSLLACAHRRRGDRCLSKKIGTVERGSDIFFKREKTTTEYYGRILNRGTNFDSPSLKLKEVNRGSPQSGVLVRGAIHREGGSFGRVLTTPL